MIELTVGLPTASSFDPGEAGENSIDPLGASPLSEVLATAVGSAGVRERHHNLRFLTLCSIGWEVMRSVPAEIEFGDRSSNLETCFEWLVVESLVAGSPGIARVESGLPGNRKAAEARRLDLPLNSERYLRNPGVFGFFGVYRTLAEHLDLLARRAGDRPLPGEAHGDLMNAWRSATQLFGFGVARAGTGEKEYRDLVTALTKTIVEGEAAPSNAARCVICKLMQPDRVDGGAERLYLRKLLTTSGSTDSDENRRELLRALKQSKVAAIMRERSNERGAEARAHKVIMKSASSRLKTVLAAIQSFEQLIVPLHWIFDSLRFELAGRGPTGIADLALARNAQLATLAHALPERYRNVCDALAECSDQCPRALQMLADRFGAFAETSTADSIIDTLVTHHEDVQRCKPPNGKQPWVFRDGTRVILNQGYRFDADASPAWREYQNTYVGLYRMRPLFNLCQSVGGACG